SGSRGLSAVTDTPDGTVILFSAGPGRVAADGRGRNSPFSEVLKKELLAPGLELESLFKRVGSEVYDKTGSQRPWMNSNLYQSFVFLEKGPAPTHSGFERKPAGAEHWDRVENSLNRIYEMETRGNAQEALSELRKLLETEDREARVYAAWDYVTQEMEGAERENYESSAEQVRSRAKDLYHYKGENDETLFLAAGWLADALINQDDLSEEERAKLKRTAIQSAEKAIEVSPDIASYHYRLGNIHFVLGGADLEAREAFARAIQLNPRHWNAWGDLITGYVSYGDDYFPASIEAEGLRLLRELEQKSRPLFDPFFYTITNLLSPATASDLEPVVRQRLEHVPDDAQVEALLKEVLEYRLREN
ncbi:MAG: caspase family protein, partial [Verrucomicrobiota bacterium]